MKSVMRLFSVLFLSMGLFLSAKAQDDTSMNAPAEDEIVCTQVAENVFDCYVMPGGEADQYEGEQGVEPEQDPARREDEDEPIQAPEERAPSQSDPYFQEMNLPINI